MVTDADHMARALKLAERGSGRTSPNPMVGALLVNDEGIVVGRGAHEFAGGPHAEIHALRDAGPKAKGATLYCTLEPCSHVGRTGPCAPVVVAAGVKRTVVAMEDPNPLVSGRGIAHLRSNGIDVTVGVLDEAARRLNRPFLTVMQRGRPFVIMKIALSLDAKVAARAGARTPLTGAASTRLVQRDRAAVDAIAVGSGTILVDDPLLTARDVYRHRPLTRVIFDRRLRTPAAARVLSTLASGPVIIVTTPDGARASPERADALRRTGARIEIVNGETTRAFLSAALQRFASEGITSIVAEGGPALHQSLWDAGLVDRVQMFVAPLSVGADGVPWIPASAASATVLRTLAIRPVGEDVLIEGDVHRID